MSMIFGGFYPIKDKKYKALRILSAVILMTLSSLYNLLGLIFGFQQISNVAVFSELISYLLTGLSFSCKIVNVFYYKNNLLLLDDMLRNPIISELETEEEEMVVKNNLKFGQTLKKFYKIYITSIFAVQFLYPLINNSDHKSLPLQLWFPFNQEEHYYTFYCIETLFIFSPCYFNVILDLLNILLMDMCAAQFELLKHRLKQFGADFTTGEAVEDDKLLFEKLKKIITYQNHVYRCSELVGETFSMGSLCQLACSVVILSFVIFKTAVTPIKSMQFLKMATYSFLMMTQISLFCYYGQKVLNSSSTVAEACFMSKWYNCSLRIQKHLVIVMNRGNQPVIMKAGQFPLTLQTLMSIWSSAYSFLTILMQMYRKGDS
uniref:Odorant receptor n=1 Tax=Apriona germarii TaxID=157307 RepID=A0A7H9SQW9_APRGE|nr:odorant receptor 1 [Apriona germarii]